MRHANSESAMVPTPVSWCELGVLACAIPSTILSRAVPIPMYTFDGACGGFPWMPVDAKFWKIFPKSTTYNVRWTSLEFPG